MACEVTDLNLEENPLDEHSVPNTSSNKPHATSSGSVKETYPVVVVVPTKNNTNQQTQTAPATPEQIRKPACSLWQRLQSYFTEVDCDPNPKSPPTDCRGEFIADTLQETACRVEKACTEIKERVSKLEHAINSDFEKDFAQNLTSLDVKPLNCDTNKGVADQAKENLKDIARINEALRQACRKDRRGRSRSRSKGRKACDYKQKPQSCSPVVKRRKQSCSPTSCRRPVACPEPQPPCEIVCPQPCPIVKQKPDFKMTKTACLRLCAANPPQCCSPPRTAYEVCHQKTTSRSCHARNQCAKGRQVNNKCRSSHTRSATMPRPMYTTRSCRPQCCSTVSTIARPDNCFFSELGSTYSRSKRGDAMCKLLISKYADKSVLADCFKPESAGMCGPETHCQPSDSVPLPKTNSKASNAASAKVSAKDTKNSTPKNSIPNANNNYGEDNFRFFRNYLSITPSEGAGADEHHSSTVDANAEVSYNVSPPPVERIQSPDVDQSSDVDRIEERISRLDRWLVGGSPEIKSVAKTATFKSPQKKKSGQGLVLGSRKTTPVSKTGQRKPNSASKSGGYAGMAARETNPHVEMDPKQRQQSPTRATDYRYDSPKRPEIIYSDSPNSGSVMRSGQRQYTPQIFPEDVIRETRSKSPVRSPPRKEMSNTPLQSLRGRSMSPYKSPMRRDTSKDRVTSDEGKHEAEGRTGAGESCVDSGGFTMFASNQQPPAALEDFSDTYLNATLSTIWDSKYESKLGIVRSLTGDYRLVSKISSVDELMDADPSPSDTYLANIWDPRYESKLTIVRSLLGDYRLASKESSVDVDLSLRGSSVDSDGSNNNQSSYSMAATSCAAEYRAAFQSEERMAAMDVSNNHGGQDEVEVAEDTTTANQTASADELKFMEGSPGSLVSGSITTDTLTMSKPPSSQQYCNTIMNQSLSSPAGEPAAAPAEGASPLLAKVTSMNLQKLLGRSHIPWCKVPASSQDVDDDVAEIRRMKAEFLKRLRGENKTSPGGKVKADVEEDEEEEEQKGGSETEIMKKIGEQKKDALKDEQEKCKEEEMREAMLAECEDRDDLAVAMAAVCIQ